MLNNKQKMLEKERFDAMKQEDMNEIIRDAERFRRIKSILYPLTLEFSDSLEYQESMITTVDDMLLSQDMQDVLTDRTLITPDNLLEYHRALRNDARILRGLRDIYKEIEEEKENRED